MPELTLVIQPPPEIKSVLVVGQGPAGAPGTTRSTQLTALLPIGGHRAVVAIGNNSAEIADCNNVAHCSRVAGISVSAASAGGQFLAQSTGVMDEPSWSWIPDQDIWLDANGILSQTLPTAPAFIQRLGYALTATRIWVEISEPILF